MKNLKEAFGLKLKEIRKSKNYTQETLAEMIDLSPRQLIRIENGENFPSAETIGKISFALNIGLETLFDFNWNEDAIYFISGKYNRPALRVIKKTDGFVIKPYSKTKITYYNTAPLSLEECEHQISNISKENNEDLTVEFFENKKIFSIKTFYPSGKIEEVLSKEDIARNELYNYILNKLKEFSSNADKLNYIKLALDALDNKDALKKFSVLIQGMGLMI